MVGIAQYCADEERPRRCGKAQLLPSQGQTKALGQAGNQQSFIGAEPVDEADQPGGQKSAEY